MNSVVEAALKSWMLDPTLICLMAVTGLIYVHGWRRLRGQIWKSENGSKRTMKSIISECLL